MLKKTKFIALFLIVCLSVSLFTMGAGMSTTASTVEKHSIIDAFQNIDLDSKPMARMWFPDAGAGADENDLIAQQINFMAEGGFGGVEVTLLADETTYTNEQAKEIGWGTPNWNSVLKKTLKAAAQVEGGFKVDITITSHWPPVINTIDPNEDTASTELSYKYAKITADDLTAGTKDLALPTTKTTDSKNVPFILTDRFNDAVAVRVASVTGAGTSNEKLTLDFDSITSLRDNVSVKEGEGHAAGIPDEAYCLEKGWNYSSVVSAFGPDPELPMAEGEKFDENGDRKRLADWQDYYEADLSGIAAGLGTLNNDSTIAAGDWVLLGTFYRGTGQVMSGGGVNTMYNRTYCVDYFSTEGIQEVLDYWNENILSDQELRTLLENSGGSIFEDSIEASHSGPFWTCNFLGRLDEGYAYTDQISAAVAASTGSSAISFNGDTASRLVEDYNLKLGSLYDTDHATVISEWASGFNYDYRAQTHALTGLDIAGAAAVVDIPEGDNATSGDGLRNMSSAVNLFDKKFLSMEAITTTKVAASWEIIASELNSNFSHGVNRVILHGTPYAKTFDNNHTLWPGWGWGGGGAGVGEFTAWSGRQIYWQDVNIIADYMSRSQAFMQNGTAKVDVAVLNSTEKSFSVQSGNSMQALLDAGYSYNILSEAMLKSENAFVTNNRIYEDGPAYKAVVLNEANILSVFALETLNSYADSGVPIILYNSDPSKVYGSETEDNNDTALQALGDALKSRNNVKVVSSKADIVTALAELGISSDAQYNESGLETSHRTDETGADYYYIYNSQSTARTATVTLKGTGTPYIMDAWTGKIIPVAKYTVGNGFITFDVDLTSKDAEMVAITPDQSAFPPTKDVYVTDTTGGEIMYVDGEIEYRGSTAGTDIITYSDGSTEAVTVSKSFDEIDLSGGGWDLQLDSYGPDDDPSNLDENNELIDPTAHKITSLYFEDIPLTAWTALPVSAEDFERLGTVLNPVTSMTEVSGIGYYSKEFTLPSDWTVGQGAYISFDEFEEIYKGTPFRETMITKITINGNVIDKISALNTTVDIGKYLRPGTNSIEIKVDTSVRNRITLETGYAELPWVTSPRYTNHGLKTVTLTPYTSTRLLQTAYQEGRSEIRYDGNWTYVVSDGFNERRARKASATGASASFTMDGTAFSLISYRSASQGIISVYIDGAFMETVDLYDTSFDSGFGTVAYVSPVLSEGKHTVTISVTGKNPKSIGYNFYLDAIQVSGSLVACEPVISDSTYTLRDSNAAAVVSLPADSNIYITGNPTGGTAVAQNGKLIYTPTNFAAEDSITYSVNGQTATVTILKADCTRYEDTFPGLQRSGTWTNYSVTSYSGGTAYRSSTVNSSVKFTFTGTGFDIISYKSLSRGAFQVAVKNSGGTTVVNETVSCYDESADILFQNPVFQSGTLDKGTYSVTITVLGSKAVEFDAVDIYK